MKKYEAPMVELTKFDVEDVITASVQSIDLTTSEARANAAADIKANTADNGGLDGVFSW